MSLLALRQADFLRILQAGNAKYVMIGLNLLLVIWIASQLANMTWGFFTPAEEIMSPPNTSQSLPVTQNADRRLIAQIPGWHLMGVASKTQTSTKTEVPTDAPDTRLKLTLRGAFASDDPASARAIIADPKGENEQYSIGDTLPGNAELSEIYPDRVILKRSGRYETLRLPVESSPGNVVQRQRGNVRRLGIQGGRSDLQKRLADVRQKMIADPMSLQGLVQAALHMDDAGNVIGYKISPGKDPALFSDLGLVNGDIVLQVNGLELSDPVNGPKALSAMSSGAPVSIKLLRNGQEQMVSMGGP